MAEEAGAIAGESQLAVTEEMDAKPTAAKASKYAKEKKVSAPKENKPRVAKTGSPAHPAYFLMIKEAILALKEKSGSSPYAIAKHMEEMYKSSLPANFRKTLAVQLKNCLARGKLVKVKSSFKLSDAGKKTVVEKKPVAPIKAKKSKSTAAATVNPKTTKPKKSSVVEKRKAPTAAKKKLGKPAKVAPKSKKLKKATPAKAKQPKSIKSPAAKRSRKASAA